MKRNSKGMLSIIVMAILALSFALPFIGVSAALVKPKIDGTTASQNVQVGKKLIVSSQGPGEVTSGATVSVYWDIAEGSGAVLLNTTTGKSDGSYTVQVTVPDAVNGSHYIWVKEPFSTASSSALNVTRKAVVTPERGLPGKTLTVKGTGFHDETRVYVALTNGSTYDVVMTTSPSTVETNEYGTFTCTFVVPTLDYADYLVKASEDWLFNGTDSFVVGASITLTPDEGPEGTVIDITGEGYAKSATLGLGDFAGDANFTWDDTYSMLCVGDIATDTDGEFSGKIVVPSWGKGTYEINVTDNNVWANATFTIDGESKTEVDPSYGAPGATITIKGYNFTKKAGIEVECWLNTTVAQLLVTATTNADGTWEDTFQAPAILFKNYKINATDEYSVWDDTGFKVGLIAMIINPTSGPSGTDVALTAIGFADGAYNMSFGDDEDYMTGNVVNEAIAKNFFVPTTEPGVYDISVTDSNENVLTTTFTVTATTSLTPTPVNAAVGYNVSFYGEHYSEKAGVPIDWYIWNSTWDDAISPKFEGSAVKVTADGNFTGYYVIPDTLLLGNSYYINATDGNDLYAETMITIVEEEIEIWPNSLSYSLGETITFTIKATFVKDDAELEIFDPEGELIFLSIFDDDSTPSDWVLSGTWQVVRYWNQVNEVGNPLLIPSDAMIGTWNWTFTDVVEDEVVAEGQITVLPTTAEQVDQRLSAVEGSLANLADDISGVTSELEDDISDLASDIADVASEVDNLRDDIVSDLADDIAGAIDAADAAADAVADLERTVSDIADVATDAKTAADSAKSAADAAKTSADDAKTAATGLTTLVYGAIGASLIAALAAIVSLMQISKKIA